MFRNMASILRDESEAIARAVSGGLRHYGSRKAAFWRAQAPMAWPCGLSAAVVVFCVNEFVLEMGLQVCKVNRMPFLRAVVYTFILSTWHLRQPGSNVGISPRLSV